jgi:D-arabinose 1-dehydrogenase-like Zn-dependent alcohol dehydrogenase
MSLPNDQKFDMTEKNPNYQCAHRWAFKTWGGALEPIEEELGPISGHEVSVRVTHCGMCHSDLHVQAGGFDMGGGKMSSLEAAGNKLPLTLGHEIVGEVVDTGPDVQGVQKGDHVIVYPWLGCGECAVCQRGDEQLCSKANMSMGIKLPGGFGDLVRMRHERYLVPFGTLDPARAATFACAGITAFGAIKKLPATTAEDWVAVVGCGGVGMTAVALLSATQAARIVAIDPDPAKREAALKHGASLAFDPNAKGVLKEIAIACSGNIAGVVDFVGAESSSSLAVNIVRRAGKVVIVGLFGGEFKLPLPMFIFKALSVSGSMVGSLPLLRELVALAQKITLPTIPIELRPISAVNQSLEDLAKGRIVGRVVLQP